MTQASPYQVPKDAGRWPAIALAIAVHLALLAFLWFGISWQSTTPVAIEAEVWSPQVQEAAPRPQPVPETPPEPAPSVKAPPQPAPPVEKPVEKPDIALEQEQKKKALERKRREEEEARAEQQREQEQKELAAKKEREAKAAAAEKLAEQEKLKKEAEQRKQMEAKLEAKRKADDEKEQKRLAQLRKDELARMMSGIEGTGGSGNAAQTTGPRGSAEYLARIAAKIRSNTYFNVPDNLSGNPPVEYSVSLLPDGRVRSIQKTRSSGVAGFDEAVLTAIKASEPFPKDDKTGKVPSTISVIHRPKDQ